MEPGAVAAVCLLCCLAKQTQIMATTEQITSEEWVPHEQEPQGRRRNREPQVLVDACAWRDVGLKEKSKKR